MHVQLMTPAAVAAPAPAGRFDRLPLAARATLAGLGVALLAAGSAWAFDGGSAMAWAVAASAAAATLVCAVLARRTGEALDAVATAAAAIGHEAGGEPAQIPLLRAGAELERSTLALRRMVDAARQREAALTARAAALGVQLETRTHQLSTLQDLSIGLAGGGDIEGLVDEALGALQQTMDYTTASVWGRVDFERFNPVVLLGFRAAESEGLGAAGTALKGSRLSRSNLQRYEQIERDGEPLIDNRPRQSLLSWLWQLVTDDARSSALYRATRAWMAVPLKVRQEVLGVLRVDHHEPDYFDRERARLLQAVGSQAALAMRHAHLLARERDNAVTAERNRIARDLHDAVSQTLFAANLMAAALVRATGAEAPPDPATTREQLLALERLNRSALAEMRMLLFELRPDALQGARLADLLQHPIEALAGRGGIEVVASIARDESLPPARRAHVYRIAQEALSNVGRHSGATRAEISWSVPEPGHAVLRVADNGHGFDPDIGHPGHFGIENMRSRAAELGAPLAVRSVPGQGTELVLELRWS